MAMIPNGNDVFTRRFQGRIHVKAPYDPAFVLEANRMGARWKRRTGVWSFRSNQFPEMAKVLNEIYGTAIKVRAGAKDA